MSFHKSQTRSDNMRPSSKNIQQTMRKVVPFVGPPLLFLLLSAAFLWQPILTGKVFLPTDLSYKYDYLWRAEASQYGAQTAQNSVLSDVADYYYPYADYAMSRMGTGHFPLW